MHILKVFYYNYYCFYKKIIKDPNPHLATVLSLSASEGLLINGTIDIFAIKWYCYQIPVWIQFSVVPNSCSCKLFDISKEWESEKDN
jgi:hypothetical protein